MGAKIQKWGNSLGVRIPKTVIEKTNLAEDSEVEIETKDGVILIFPAKKKLLLANLLGQINKKNLHNVENDEVEGNEVW